jgi:glycosyltransferase involved in cell wall biosynthesis
MPGAIAMADRIIASSTSTAQALEAEFPVARGKVRVVLPGVTLPVPSDDKASLTSLGIIRPYVLFVGTLEPRKNLARLLDAYAKLPQAIRTANQLVVAGGKGWGGVDISQMLLDRNLAPYVITPGYVSDAQLSCLYAHARFLALPALYEGFGLPLVEAMAQGVPVLTSNSSSLPEVAGDAGVLVDPLDVDAISAGILRLLTDDVYHQALAARARPNAARFSWSKAAREVMRILNEAVQVRRDISISDRI